MPAVASAASALLVLAALSAVFHLIAEYRGAKRLTYVFKPLTTALLVTVAAAIPPADSVYSAAFRCPAKLFIAPLQPFDSPKELFDHPIAISELSLKLRDSSVFLVFRSHSTLPALDYSHPRSTAVNRYLRT